MSLIGSNMSQTARAIPSPYFTMLAIEELEARKCSVGDCRNQSGEYNRIYCWFALDESPQEE